MKTLNTSAISSTARAPISDRTLNHLIESHKEALESLIKGLLTNTTGIVILYGCVATVGGGSYSLTPGAAYYNGEIFSVDAFSGTASGGEIPVWVIETTYRSGDPVEFKNSAGDSAGMQNFHEIRKLKWQFGASGSGILNYDSGVSRFTNLTQLKSQLDTHTSNISGHETRILSLEGIASGHEARLDDIEPDVIDHENRLDFAEADILDHESRLLDIEPDIIDHENRLDFVEADIINLENNKADKSVEAWQLLTLSSGWAPVGTPNKAPMYRKDSSGRVYLMGWATNVVGASATIGVLPVGYRPTFAGGFLRFHIGTNSSNVANFVNVNVNGEINVPSTSSAHVIHLDQVSFFID